MDAVEFIKERDRMCTANKEGCAGCPANSENCLVSLKSPLYAEEQVKIVERWSAAHPRKTRQSVFLEQYPNAMVEDGVLTICPRTVMGREAWKKNGCDGISCVDCYHEFWSQEVDE